MRPKILVLALIGMSIVGVSTFGFLVRAIFYPPAVEMVERYADRDGTRVFDHAGLDAVLHQHVKDGVVDYSGLVADSSGLDAYLTSLGGAPLGELGRDELLALWINAYNACTLRLILDYWTIDGTRLASIRDIPSANRWDAVRWKIGGETVSLSQIEHDEIRRHFREPRIHFALVCASVGCPPLRNSAYTGEEIEAQLEDQTRRVHGSATWFSFDDAANTVRLTSLYDWYAGDFNQTAGSALAFASRYSSTLRAALDIERRPSIDWIDYDWSLNGR